MKTYIYIPSSLRAAASRLRDGFAQELNVMPKRDFLRVWCSVAYLYPGLHPDGFAENDSGWPRVLKRFAAEAWRRYEAAEITDNEFYCYQATKARVRGWREHLERSTPWLLRDHFAV